MPCFGTRERDVVRFDAKGHPFTFRRRLAGKVLRELFTLLWAISPLRPVLRRWWPPMRQRVRSWQFRLHPADNITDRVMWVRNQPPELASIARLTLLIEGKRALVFDLGANTGVYTLALATSSGPGSRLVAFEPNPSMAQRLRTNLALNGLTDRVQVEQVALAAAAGDAVLHLDAYNLGASSLHHRQGAGLPGTIPVVTRRLADFLPPATDWPYDTFVVKADIEGYEDAVFAPFLAAVPPKFLPDAILLETALAHRWQTDIRETLRTHGYTPTFEGDDGNTLFLRRPLTL